MLRRRTLVIAALVIFVFNMLLLSANPVFELPAVLSAALLPWPVVWAWYRPMSAWGAMMVVHIMLTGLGLALGSLLMPQPWLINQVAAQLPVMYVLALSAPLRVTVGVFATTIAAGLMTRAFIDLEPALTGQAVLSWALTLVVAAVLGYVRQIRRLDTLRVAEEMGRRRLLEERARIARELHDVVAHHMSVIAVQAASAPYRIEGGVGEAAAKEFAAINAAARESLRDMRHLLGALRGTDADPGTEPQPGLGDLGKLVESVRRAGVPVETAIDDPSPPSPVVSLTAYRIVQEALSNVIRHAPGARTVVTVREEGGDLAVEVENERPERPGAAPAGSGHGLAGMRERVAALGGRLTAETTETGGFAVRARLPDGEGG